MRRASRWPHRSTVPVQRAVDIVEERRRRRRWSAPPICRRRPTPSPSSRSASRSREGQTLLIIEAMKTMNQIPSPRAGTVTAILFEDGQPVEYGEPLVVIE